MIDWLSYGCIGLGLVFWFWGTSFLLSQRSVLFKLHNLLTWQLLSMHQQMLKTPYLLDKSAFRLHSLLSPG